MHSSDTPSRDSAGDGRGPDGAGSGQAADPADVLRSGRRQTFRRSARLTHDHEYQAVYDARVRKSAGGFTVSMRPNGLAQHRLGIAVGRRAGTAPQRSRLKRLIREAFRTARGSLPMARVAGPGAGEVGGTGRGTAVGPAMGTVLGGAMGMGYDIVVGARSVVPKGRKGLTMAQAREVLVQLINAAHREWQRRAPEGASARSEREK